MKKPDASVDGADSNNRSVFRRTLRLLYRWGSDALWYLEFQILYPFVGFLRDHLWAYLLLMAILIPLAILAGCRIGDFLWGE